MNHFAGATPSDYVVRPATGKENLRVGGGHVNLDAVVEGESFGDAVFI